MSFCAIAQDTVSLAGVEVTAYKTDLSHLGKKKENLDSLSRSLFRFASVGEALSFNTPVYIKTYGPGGISTTGLRGGNASQTAVLWNGINIQNAMLAQVDLNLLPALLFDDIGVEYGGSSALFGGGAVAGSIQLESRSPFAKGASARVDLGGGSFGKTTTAAKATWSGRRCVAVTKLYDTRATNNYNFLDADGVLQRQQHAGYRFSGFMQGLRFLLGPRQLLSLNAWANTNARDLPAFQPGAPAAQRQRDDALRITADWNYSVRRFRTTVRAACLNDRIRYTDSLAEINSDSRVQTLLAENENYLQWGRDQELHVGLNFTSSSAKTGNYAGVRSVQRVGWLIGNRSALLNGRLLLNLAARVDYFSAGNLPVTGNTSAEYKLTSAFSLKVNIARVYRQPSLNELYWLPGGNPDLQAEQGYSGEGEIVFKRRFTHWDIYMAGAAFTRAINNWILWVPGAGGNATPLNLQKVWSRGTETTWRIGYTLGKWTAGLQLVTGYVLSTVVEQRLENDASQGRQLMFTPRYTLSSRFTVAYGEHMSLSLYHQYTGYRFTSADNSSWLDPYHLSSLRATLRAPFGRPKLNLYAVCNNVFNTSYTLVSGHPMALRSYEAGVSLQLAGKHSAHSDF